MITLVALLTVRDAAAFNSFEMQAEAIMKTHGGRIDVVFRPNVADSRAEPQVDEIHVVKFPNQKAFENYRSDKKLLELAPLREQAISQTAVYTPAL